MRGCCGHRRFRLTQLDAVSVATTGDVAIPCCAAEQRLVLPAADGAFWYVTVAPSQGIELPPRGPSAIHRIGWIRKMLLGAQDADNAIDGLLPGDGGRFAYTVGGTLFLVQGSGQPECRNR